MPRTLLLVASLILALSITGCARTQPVYNVNNAPVVGGTSANLTTLQVRNAIFKAAQEKGWIVNEEAEGRIVAKIFVRGHMAEVNIIYAANEYSIAYRNSNNLLYDGRMIHRNYNKWVQLLDRQIKEELARS